MILGDPITERAPAAVPPTTIDELFRRAAERSPDAIALVDPPNRESFTDGPPRRLTYAEADRVVSAIAVRLRSLGLQSDAAIGIQLANTVESVLTLLGVLRAGMIAVPMPLLWRQHDAAAALRRLGAKAVITATRAGNAELAALARQIAAEVFSIRHVAAFGSSPLDGVISFDGVFTATAAEPPSLDRDGEAAAHVALVTWDVTSKGAMPVARNHAELIAGGIPAVVSGGLQQDAKLLAAFALNSFTGLAGVVVPWLLSGGTLALHHDFDAETFAAQCRDGRPDAVLVPGPLAVPLNDAGLLSHTALKNVLALWRAPERLATGAPWQHVRAALVDILAFGEIAVLASPRDEAGKPTPLTAGKIVVSRGSADSIPVAEMACTVSGTLALRGSMVPRHAFPPGAERLGKPYLRASTEGFVDTGYACRIDHATDTFMVTAPPAGLVSVGGYRFVLGELEQTVWRANAAAFITALPDALSGHRLAGISGAFGDMGAALSELGANPLLVEAFKDGAKAA